MEQIWKWSLYIRGCKLRASPAHEHIYLAHNFFLSIVLNLLPPLKNWKISHKSPIMLFFFKNTGKVNLWIPIYINKVNIKLKFSMAGVPSVGAMWRPPPKKRSLSSPSQPRPVWLPSLPLIATWAPVGIWSYSPALVLTGTILNIPVRFIMYHTVLCLFFWL